MGLGDTPGWELLMYLCLIPMHTWNLVSNIGFSSSSTQGLVQTAALFAFFVAVVIVIRRPSVRSRYKTLFVVFGYPVVVCVTNYL